MNIPTKYNEINAYNSYFSPSTVHVKNVKLTAFFAKYLLEKAISVYNFSLPENFAENYFTYVLFLYGYIAIIKTDKFGVIPQQCGLQGFDVMYQPTRAIISNPLLTGIVNPQIDTQCAIIKLTPNYTGIYDLVSFYADMMALTAEAAGINILNSKLAYVFASQNKAGEASLKKAFDLINSGNPAVFIDNNLLDATGKPTWYLFEQDLKKNYIASDMLLDLRRWEQEFCREIGIPTANSEKSERLITDEVNTVEHEVSTRAEWWLDIMRKGFEKANSLFGIDMKVEMRITRDVDGSDVINQRNL